MQVPHTTRSQGSAKADRKEPARFAALLLLYIRLGLSLLKVAALFISGFLLNLLGLLAGGRRARRHCRNDESEAEDDGRAEACASEPWTGAAHVVSLRL